METKSNFPKDFRHPRFASGYDQKQLFISDVDSDNKHREIPKLMIIVQK